MRRTRREILRVLHASARVHEHAQHRRNRGAEPPQGTVEANRRMTRVHQHKRRIGATVSEHVHGHEHGNSHNRRRVAAAQRQGAPQGGKENRQVRHQQAQR